MAQELLVDQLIDDGQRIIDKFVADGLDVAVAFWATSDERSWRLYIASPAFDDSDPGGAAQIVYDSLSEVPGLTIEPALDIRTLNDRNPTARDALRLAPRPDNEGGIRYRGPRLGDLAIEEAYIYPRPAIPLRQEFTISYVRQGESNVWSATTRKGKLHRGLRYKGFISSAHGPGEKPEEHKFASVAVFVEVNPYLDERTVASNPAISTMLDEQARSLADEIFKKQYPGAEVHHHDLALAPA